MVDANSAVDKVQRVLTFMKKHAVLLTLLLVLALQFMPNDSGAYPWGGIWMRMKPAQLPIAESAAASSVQNFLEQQAAELARQQYPNLPEENRRKVIQDILLKVQEQNKEKFESEKKRLAQEIRDHYSYEVDGRKFLYMPDIDPYYYLRYARNIVEKGHYYDELKDGKPWDTHMAAPIGAGPDTIWHPQVLFLIYKVFSIFDQVTLMEAANYFPIIFIFLSLILAFLIAHRVSGNLGGFFAATMLAILPGVIGRTPWGHADTDAYNIFFPLLIIWLFFEAMSAKSFKRQLLFGGLTGLAVGLFANFWSGWWYLLDFAIGAVVIGVLVELVFHGRKMKEGFGAFWQYSHARKFIGTGFSMFVVAAIFCSLTIGFRTFWDATFKYALTYRAIKEAALPSLWPNVFTTVAELNPASMNEIITSFGGKLLFIIAVFGIILLLIKRDENGKLDVTYSAFLTIWFIGTIYMALKGIRFILLIGPAFAVAFGSGAGLLYERLSAFAERNFHIKKVVTTVIVILIFGLIIVNPTKTGTHMVRNAYQSVLHDVPIVNDAWANALTNIKDKSQPNAIINSWWDFGHHFKYFADRAVTFDGATQNSPQAHWVGRVLQTDNEEEAVAILRMLDCGANTAYEEVFKVTKDPLKSVTLVKQIIMQDKETASNALKDAGLPESILQFTHCDPPEDYFIASGDMIGKAGVWAHFGLWSFERAETWLKWRTMPEGEAVPKMVERFGWTEEQAKQAYQEANALTSEEAANQWISPWPGYATTDASDCSISGDLLVCGPVSLNMSAQRAEVRLGQGTALAGKVIVYSKDGSKKELVPSEGNKDLAVVIWPTASGSSALATYSYVADSMFTRMYYMKGLGLKHFRPFDEQSQLIGGKIYVYKVDWAGKEPYVPVELIPKESIGPGAQVSLVYIGWLDDGSVFDSSIPGWKEMNISQYTSFDGVQMQPLTFVVGKGMLIPGFEKQIIGMKKGDMKTITIPPEEAYGTDPSKHPLGNKTLHFRLRIESIQ
jgi:dolichyl-diphosphooligosaccharide--protein glycosyltransferase